MPMALAILDSRFFLADDDDKAEAWTPLNCNDWTKTWLALDGVGGLSVLLVVPVSLLSSLLLSVVSMSVLLVLPVSLFSSFVFGTLIPPHGADANRLAPSSRQALLMLSKRAVRAVNAVSSVVILVVDAANAVSSVVILVVDAVNAVSSVVILVVDVAPVVSSVKILVVDAATVVSSVVTLVCSNANAVSIVLKRLKEQWFLLASNHSEQNLKGKEEKKEEKIHSHYFACFCC